MGSQRYVTIIDPFQRKYGDRIGALLFIPSFVAEIVWSAATLVSLGKNETNLKDVQKKIKGDRKAK